MKAVQGRIPVFVDGGVRRGTDVFKALALGASGIFVSNFVLYQSIAIVGDETPQTSRVLTFLFPRICK